jgi:uncharacterized protein (TIGR02284 family)
MFDKSNDINILNSLIETTLDSADGYRRSAEEADSSQFKSMFIDRAQERQQVVGQLQQEVRRLGGNPEDDGSVLAAAHRAFLTIRDKITGSDDKAVLDEVDRGETYLKDKWEAALKDDNLSTETRSLITQCYETVRQGATQWQSINRSMESTPSSY